VWYSYNMTVNKQKQKQKTAQKMQSCVAPLPTSQTAPKANAMQFQPLQGTMDNYNLKSDIVQTDLADSGWDNFKTWGSAGGLSGITLDVTFSVTNTPADSLQAVQTFMGNRTTTLGKLGTYSWTYNSLIWDAFVDGGKNSPYVTMSGNPPSHPTKPYYLTAAEVASQVSFSTNSGTIRVYDRPTAVVHFDEFHFETAIVAVNYNGTKEDKVLKVFKWGWTGKGTKPTVVKGTEIAGKDSGISVRDSVSPEFANIVKHDYPDYKYS